MKVFLTGATGFVGTYVLEQLVARGHDAICLVRNGGDKRLRTKAADSRIRAVTGDLLAPQTYEPALRECDAVIHLVGIIREDVKRGVTFQAIHVEGTKLLAAASAKAGIRKFVHMSALGASERAASDYHRTKFAAEEAVRGSGLPYVIFRPSVIFGPGDAFVNMLAGLVKLPLTPVIGDGTYRLQPVSVRTVASVFEKALTHETANEAFEVGGPEPMRYNDMLMEIGRAMNRKTRLIHLPLWLMKPLVRAMERFSFFPVTSNQLTMLLEENVCRDGNRFAEVFHEKPVPFAEGIREYIKP